MALDQDTVLRNVVRLFKERYGIAVPPWRYRLLSSELARLDAESAGRSYRRLLQGDEQAWSLLAAAMVVPETFVFRHVGHFRLMSRELAAIAASGRQCSVLSAGCSTGEEVWSTAAVLASLPAPTVGKHQVIGWDLCAHHLSTARRGSWGTWSCRMGYYEFGEWFHQEGSRWTVAERLREIVSFSQVNLLDPPPVATSFDAILFRNVSIYLDQASVDRVVASLVGMLAPDGLLLVGPSDPVQLPPHEWQQSNEEDGARVYRRLQPNPEIGAGRERAGRQSREAAPAPEARSNRETSVSTRRPMAGTGTCTGTQAPEHQSRRLRESSGRSSARSPALPDQSQTTHDGPEGGLLARVEALANRGRYCEAYGLLSRHGADPTPEGLLWEGILLLNLGRHDDAVTTLRKCVFLRPEEPIFRHWLAAAFRASGQAPRADRESRIAAELEQA